MDWQAESELNFGMLIQGKVSPTRYNEQMFFPPYDRGFSLLEKGKAAVRKEIGLSHYQSALHAVKELNGAGDDDTDWAKELEKAALSWGLAEEFERINKKLRSNETPDFSKIKQLQDRYQQGLASKFVTLEDVWDDEEEGEWLPCGVNFLDYWLGGIPKFGLWTVGGIPKGGGKTSFAMGLAMAFVKENPTLSVAVFSIEMMVSQFKKRLREFEASKKMTKEERQRIHLCDEVLDENHAIARASAIPNLGLVIIDFADLMVSGEVNEPKMSSLYRTLANGAKSLKTSICLIVQFNGEYKGGLPRPHHVRYTRMAEALVVLNLMLYIPWRGWFEAKETDILPSYNDAGYALKWMTRYKTLRNVGIPHAMLIKLDSAGGWDMDDRGESFLLNT